MDEHVQSELVELLKTGGRNLCTMPRTLGILLHQRCPDAEATIRDLETALTAGCVGPILAGTGPIDEAELTTNLVQKTSMAPDRARWVIESWVRALDQADAPPAIGRDWSEWNKLDVSQATQGGSGGYQRAVAHLIIVGVLGAAGGATLGIYHVLHGNVPAGPWREALEDIDPWMQVPALLLLGILGGFAGGLLGWIALGGRSWTYDAMGGSTLGRLVLAALGAFHGAAIGVMACVVLLGLIGVMVGSLIGGLIGAVLGLLIAEGISRMMW
jgi:hypothetical protein